MACPSVSLPPYMVTARRQWTLQTGMNEILCGKHALRVRTLLPRTLNQIL
jgi:hypothetical protein